MRGKEVARRQTREVTSRACVPVSVWSIGLQHQARRVHTRAPTTAHDQQQWMAINGRTLAKILKGSRGGIIHSACASSAGASARVMLVAASSGRDEVAAACRSNGVSSIIFFSQPCRYK